MCYIYTFVCHNGLIQQSTCTPCVFVCVCCDTPSDCTTQPCGRTIQPCDHTHTPVIPLVDPILHHRLVQQSKQFQNKELQTREKKYGEKGQEGLIALVNCKNSIQLKSGYFKLQGFALAVCDAIKKDIVTKAQGGPYDHHKVPPA